jgi:hypothetical protein
MPLPLGTGAPAGGDVELKGGRRRGVSVKTLKKMLKKAGLKTSGRKSALTRRAKKAHLKMRGGGEKEDTAAALKAKVEAGEDYTAEKTAALAAGWTADEVEGVIRDATPAAPAAPAEGGRHRRGHRGSRKSRSRKH